MIGERIKAYRMDKDLSAKQLAEKAEVTPGYISQIERNLISPSLSVLMRIADILDISLVSLFSETDEQEEVTVIKKENRTKIRFADTNLEYQFVTPYSRRENICTQMEMIYFSLKGKNWGSSIRQCHKEAAECAVVLKGQLEYHIEDKVYNLEEGDSIYVPPNTIHQIYNPGEIEAEAIVVISPPYY